jgi:hypothetical protein
MELTELIIDPTVLTIGVSGSARAAGLHASDLYNDFYADSNPKKYWYLRRDLNSTNSINPLLVEPGLIFENMLEEGLQRRLADAGSKDGSIERPGEFTHKGIFEGTPFALHYNPDLFIFNGVFRVGEIKATWMWSTVTAEEYEAFKHGDRDAALKIRDLLLDPKYDKYLTQLKLYMKCLETLYGRLYIFYVNGTGKPPFPPQLLAWDLMFTQDELDMNYYMLLNHGLSKGMLR